MFKSVYIYVQPDLNIVFSVTTMFNPICTLKSPLCVDSVTEEQLLLGYAHVLVEINVESEFPKEVDVMSRILFIVLRKKFNG